MKLHPRRNLLVFHGVEGQVEVVAVRVAPNRRWAIQTRDDEELHSRVVAVVVVECLNRRHFVLWFRDAHQMRSALVAGDDLLQILPDAQSCAGRQHQERGE